MRTRPCPVCLHPGADVSARSTSNTSIQVICRRCGRFITTEEADEALSDRAINDAQRATLSGFLRERDGFRFDSKTLPKLLAIRALAVAEKGDRLLAYLARREPVPGRLIQLQCDDPVILATTHAWDTAELTYLAREYLGRGESYLSVGGGDNLTNNAMQVQVAPAGWARLAALREAPIESDIGFVAMWFHPGLEPLRDIGIMPAIRDAGYEPKVINKHEHANRIDDEIVSLIRRSKFVVADFTGSRGGVYFEAGLATGLGRPVIWTCKQSTLDKRRLHFDIDHFNFLTWNEEPDGCEDFKVRLQNRIESLLGRGPHKSSD